MRQRSRLILVCCVAVGAVLGGAAASCSGNKRGSRSGEPPSVTLLLTTDLQGTIEPCGCTTDPLGDIARTAAVLDRIRGERATVYLDGGSLLYSNREMPPGLETQEALKADLLVGLLRDRLRPAAVALGPYDLAAGAAAVRPARQAANVAGSAGIALEPPRVVEAGGVKVGVFGVVSPAALGPAGVEASDPAKAAADAVRSLRSGGARVVVGLAHMTRVEASELARKVEGIDFLVVGQTTQGSQLVLRHEPVRVGDTWLVEPADRGQAVARLDLAVRGDGAFADAIGEARARVELEELGRRIETLAADLTRWEADPSAEPAFVAQKGQELAGLEKERAALEKQPLRAPASGPYFTLEQIEIRKRLPCDEQVQAAKNAFDRAAGEANLVAFADRKPAEPAAGQAGYVGREECEMCHDEAADFWKTTKHAAAWETLEKYDKQLNLDCIYCHVTGFDRPGGSTLAHNELLRDVQCETCHGPGSLHVERDGDTSVITLSPDEALCVTCHNEEHSDTFAFEAYLRDIVGEGHGAGMRERLGDGPTGRELRQAGLEKAGLDIGEGCPK